MSIHATGHNVLVELISKEQATDGGLILPTTNRDDERKLSSGKVLNVGPGFLIPISQANPDRFEDTEINRLLGEDTRPSLNAVHIPLDVQIGDTIYFPIKASYEVHWKCQTWYVIPYQAIMLFERSGE